MSELAQTPYLRSLSLDWAGLGGDDLSFVRNDDTGAVLIRKGARTGDLSTKLDIALPEPHRATDSDEFLVVAEGPRQWIFLCPLEQATVLARRLARALEGETAIVTDQSEALFLLELAGDNLDFALAHGGALGLLKAGPCGCARGRFAGIAVTLIRLAPGVAQIVAQRVHEPYLFSWFAGLVR